MAKGRIISNPIRLPLETDKPVGSLRARVEKELRANILSFWTRFAEDHEYGGFRGRIENDLRVNPLASKGLILNARILWTFAKAYDFYRDSVFLDR